jgi:hypothetical protein
VIKKVGSRIARGRGGANVMQDGAVDSQHVRGVKENLQLCIKGHHPTSGFLLPGNPHAHVRDGARFKNKLMGVMVYF